MSINERANELNELIRNPDGCKVKLDTIKKEVIILRENYEYK